MTTIFSNTVVTTSILHPGLRGLAQQHTLGFQSGWRQCANNPRFIFPNSIPVSSLFRFFNLPFTQTVVSSSNPLVSSSSPPPPTRHYHGPSLPTHRRYQCGVISSESSINMSSLYTPSRWRFCLFLWYFLIFMKIVSSIIV